MLALLTLLILASQVRAASLSGDFNGDWKVDAADYVAARASAGNLATWRLNYGKTVADYPGVVKIKRLADYCGTSVATVLARPSVRVRAAR